MDFKIDKKKINMSSIILGYIILHCLNYNAFHINKHIDFCS